MSNNDLSVTTEEESERLFDSLVRKGVIEISGDKMRSEWFGTGVWVSRSYMWEKNRERQGYREDHFAEIVRQVMQNLFENRNS